jgi:hypothetical protein
MPNNTESGELSNHFRSTNRKTERCPTTVLGELSNDFRSTNRKTERCPTTVLGELSNDFRSTNRKTERCPTQNQVNLAMTSDPNTTPKLSKSVSIHNI